MINQLLLNYHFFSFALSLVEPFLRKYQCDKPMIPFMYTDLKSLIQSLLKLVVKQNVLSQCKTGIQIKQLDLCNKENLLNLKGINLGFAVPNIIAELRRNDTATLAEVKEVKVGTQKFIIGMIIKLFERSPLGSISCRYASIFEPPVSFELERNLLTKRMKFVLKFMTELNIMDPCRCDKALSEFNSFCDNEFDESSCSFDEFYFEKIGIQKYGVLSFVLKLSLTKVLVV